MNTKDKETLLLTGFFCTFLAVVAINKYFIIGAYAILCICTLLGPKQALQALSLNYIIILLNPSVYNIPSDVTLLRWLILLLAGFRVLPSITTKSFRYLIPLGFFFLMVTVLAWEVSPCFQLSFLKISVFTFCAGTVLTAFNSLDGEKLNELKRWFYCLTAAVVLLSLPTVLVPKVGFFRNGSGFQGILNHPQAFGVFLAPPAAYLASCLFLRKGRSSSLLWAFAVVVIVSIFITRARTAMLALLLSFAFTLMVGFFRQRQGALASVPRTSLLKIAGVTSLLLIIVAVSPGFSQKISAFWLKGQGESVENSFYASRGGGIAYQWKRFLQQPWTGNGFGIDEAHGNEKKQASFLDIPISAPAEKGFLPMAFLEEVGGLGLLLFLPFFLTLLNSALYTGDCTLLSVFFACLLVNIGEAVFFSPGQTGGYLWLLLGLSTATGWKNAHEI